MISATSKTAIICLVSIFHSVTANLPGFYPCNNNQPWSHHNQFQRYRGHTDQYYQPRYPYYTGQPTSWNVDQYMRARPHVFWGPPAKRPPIYGHPQWYIPRFNQRWWGVARGPVIGDCQFVGHGCCYYPGQHGRGYPQAAVLVANFPPGGIIREVFWEKLAGSQGCRAMAPNYCRQWQPINYGQYSKFSTRPCGGNYHGNCYELNIRNFDQFRDSGYYRARTYVHSSMHHGQPQHVFVDVRVCPFQRNGYYG